MQNNVLSELYEYTLIIARFLSEASLSDRLSMVSFVVSIFTLYITILRPARLKIYAGDFVFVSLWNDIGGNLALNLPICIVNSGSRAGVVRRFALALSVSDTKNGIILRPHRYMEFGDTASLHYSAVPTPEIIKSNDTNTILMQFVSHTDWLADLHMNSLEIGAYNLVLLAWIGSNRKPRKVASIRITIDHDMIDTVEAGNYYAIETSSWKEWTHGPLSSQRFKWLFD